MTLSLKDSLVKISVFALVSLAVGALIGDAFLHLIPEAFETSTDPLQTSAFIIAGILLFFIIEKFLHWHHHHGLEAVEPAVHPVGKMVLISDGVHNFIDGLIIGASFLVSPEVGVATTLAVILHEIPQEIGDYGVLIHAGYSKVKALFFNFISALFAFFGAGVALLIGVQSSTFTEFLLPFAAGGFIYIAMTDLIPELHKQKAIRNSIIQIISILVGLLAMASLLFIEGEHHDHEDIHGDETHQHEDEQNLDADH
jgi:zinc and cadmium transporter